MRLAALRHTRPAKKGASYETDVNAEARRPIPDVDVKTINHRKESTVYAKDKSTVIDRREMLRVKLKSLAAEARIIRREEQRSWGQIQSELHWHRVKDLRSEARHTHLAYGFIKGLRWEQMEPKADKMPQWERVRAMLKKYGPRDFVEPECMRPLFAVAA